MTLLGYAPSHAVVTVPVEGSDVRVEIVLRPTVLSLEGINVTASPRSADPLNITQSTVELSGKALERNLGTSVAQTLSSQPGLSVRYGGPAASTPVIRGLAGERVLVVQNGQRTGDLSSTSRRPRAFGGSARRQPHRGGARARAACCTATTRWAAW